MKTEITHPIIGLFKYDESLGWYEGQVSLASENVALYLSAESEAEAESTLSSASSRIPSLEFTLAAAKSYAAEQLLELKNGEWRDEDGSTVSCTEFIEKLHTESVTFYPDQNMEVVFKDGGLFFGHVVLVSCDEKEKFTDATIAG